KNRSDPSVDWTWWQIILLVTGFIIFLIGLILIGVGIYKTIRRKEIPKLEIKEIPKLEIKEIPKPEIPLSLINKVIEVSPIYNKFGSYENQATVVKTLLESCRDASPEQLKIYLQERSLLKIPCEIYLDYINKS